MSIRSCARAAALACWLLFANGCVGAAFNHGHTLAVVVADTAVVDWTVYRADSPRVLTKKDVLKLRDQPRETRQEDGIEVWTYRDNLAFSGVVLVAVVVPIPPMAPVEYRKTHYHFRGDSLVRIVNRSGVLHGVICGLSWDVSAGDSGYGWGGYCGKM